MAKGEPDDSKPADGAKVVGKTGKGREHRYRGMWVKFSCLSATFVTNPLVNGTANVLLDGTRCE